MDMGGIVNARTFHGMELIAAVDMCACVQCTYTYTIYAGQWLQLRKSGWSNWRAPISRLLLLKFIGNAAQCVRHSPSKRCKVSVTVHFAYKLRYGREEYGGVHVVSMRSMGFSRVIAFMVRNTYGVADKYTYAQFEFNLRKNKLNQV